MEQKAETQTVWDEKKSIAKWRNSSKSTRGKT